MKPFLIAIIITLAVAYRNEVDGPIDSPQKTVIVMDCNDEVERMKLTITKDIPPTELIKRLNYKLPQEGTRYMRCLSGDTLILHAPDSTSWPCCDFKRRMIRFVSVPPEYKLCKNCIK